MNALQDYLDNLASYEVAALYKYRYDSFMSGTQEKILNELHSRNISIDSIDALIEFHRKSDQELKNSNYCPRCFSSHFYLASEKDSIYLKYETVELNNRFKTCLICLFSHDKLQYQKKRKWAWNFFGILHLISRRES